MARPKRAKQFSKACIFCRRPANMTNEHVWGQWLKPYVHKTANKHVLHQKTVGRIGTVDRHQFHIRAGASPLHSKVKVVCVDCNTKWLRRIQEAARPHLLPLVECKDQILLGVEGQRAIATWATMATITGEFVHHKLASIAVPHSDRDALRDTIAPLPDWRIWIGNYHRHKWDGSYFHACQPIHFEGDMEIPNVQDPSTPLTNTQWSTFVVGKLYLHTASSSTSPDLIREWHWPNAPRARNLLVQIWPMRESVIAWPIQSMTDADAWRFAQAHFMSLHLKNRVRPL